MKSRLFALLILLALALSACGGNAPSATEPSSVSSGMPVAVDTPAPLVDTPPLTLDQLLNMEYQLSSSNGIENFRLVDGAYQSGTDTTTLGYVSVNLIREMVAFGDINADGAIDAVVPIAISFGGSGQFISLNAVINRGGQPFHNQAVSYGLGDRPKLNKIAIAGGRIYVDMLVAGPDDGLCCPTQPVLMVFEYNEMGYRLMHVTTSTPAGALRDITIKSPAGEAEVPAQTSISGSFTVGPFENNVFCHVYDQYGMAVTEFGATVQSDGMGGPGTFNIPIDFAALNVSGRVRVDVGEFSAADGSILMLDSIYLNVK